MGDDNSLRLATALTVLTVCSCATSSDITLLEDFYIDGLLEEAGITGVRIERNPEVKNGYQVVTTGEWATGIGMMGQAIILCAMSYKAKQGGSIWFQIELENGEDWGVKSSPGEAAFRFAVDSDFIPEPQSMSGGTSLMGWTWCQSVAEPQYHWEEPEAYQPFLVQPQ